MDRFYWAHQRRLHEIKAKAMQVPLNTLTRSMKRRANMERTWPTYVHRAPYLAPPDDWKQFKKWLRRRNM